MGTWEHGNSLPWHNALGFFWQGRSLKIHIYLWRKVVCFVLQLWDPPNWDASDHVLCVVGKLSTRRGARVWFHDDWTCGGKVFEYWMKFSLKIKLNQTWKFRRNVPLVLLERSRRAEFNGIYLVQKIGFRMWDILDSKVIFCGWKFK
jgi:hypothetical protein